MTPKKRLFFPCFGGSIRGRQRAAVPRDRASASHLGREVWAAFTAQWTLMLLPPARGQPTPLHSITFSEARRDTSRSGEGGGRGGSEGGRGKKKQNKSPLNLTGLAEFLLNSVFGRSLGSFCCGCCCCCAGASGLRRRASIS